MGYGRMTKTILCSPDGTRCHAIIATRIIELINQDTRSYLDEVSHSDCKVEKKREMPVSLEKVPAKKIIADKTL